ncbi:MAG TPA: cupin domain-containing protein [Alistipes sp.]|uniref:cupin domain-containing protein n=1 Tax=Alistipes sp. TaxID=1872444 RepID=UPI000E873B52|nr:cupin domain-containing protein [Alistipes sp.]HAW64473.1 cupin domain-containing protein [Alistipes sp.]HJC76987.1 cupin domain-containing protein [Candidatus Alistipes excrementavium]
MGKQDGGRVLRSVVVADAATSWDGVCLPAYPAGAPRLSVVRFTVEPRARLPLHRHPVINAGMVLQGELTVVAAGGEERTFRAGEGIVEVVDRVHYGENRGSEPLELVMFYAGAEGLPLSGE